MEILNGWKEIANYLGRGVRTAQRWESLGLPVHRPRGAKRSAVTALPDELERWVAATPKESLAIVENETERLRAENEMLRAENENLQRQLSEARLKRMPRFAASRVAAPRVPPDEGECGPNAIAVSSKAV